MEVAFHLAPESVSFLLKFHNHTSGQLLLFSRNAAAQSCNLK